MHGTLTSIVAIITLLVFLSNTVVAQNENIVPPPPPPSKSDEFSPSRSLSWNPSMVAVIICLISAFCVIGCVSVYIHKCSEQRFMSDLVADDDDVEINNSGSRSRRRPRRRRATVRGLDPTIIDTFPMFLYSDVKGLKLGNKGALECAVCLNEFEDNETLRLLPQCSHVFHPDCIDAWLASHVTCPVCRADLILVPKEEELIGDYSLSHHLWSQPILPDEIADMNASAIHIDIMSSTPQVMVNPSQSAEDHALPARTASKSTPRIDEKFHRSHSMSHLLVQPGEDCERFTLRLSEEVKSQLMKSELSRAKSCVIFPRVKSSRKGGYRSRSSSEIGRGGGGAGKSSNYYEREVRSDRWLQGFTVVAPPFLSRGSSTRSSSKNEVEWEEKTVAPRNNSLFRSVKCPFDRLFGHVAEKENNGGERSFNRLRGESSV